MNNSHVKFLHAFNLAFCVGFFLNLKPWTHRKICRINSEQRINNVFRKKRLLIWFPKKEIKIKKIYPFLSALYSITTDRHGIWIVNKYVFSPYFFMSFLVKQFVYIHNEIKRLEHALWRQKHSLFIESIQSKWYVAAKLSII